MERQVTLSITADALLGVNSKDFGLTDEETRLGHMKSAVVGFVTTAPRKVRRAVVHGTVSFAQTTWKGVKVIGNGIWSVLPYMLYLSMALGIVALTMFGIWVNVMFIQFLFTANALLGYLAVLVFALQIVGLIAGGVYRLSRAFK